MGHQEPTEAPPRFLKILKRELARNGLSLRKFAELAGVSPGYVSRLLNKERGVPGDDLVKKFEEVLHIEPRGILFDAAGRHDPIAARVLKKSNARLLMRTIAPLNEKELEKLLEVANELAAKHKGGPSAS